VGRYLELRSFEATLGNMVRPLKKIPVVRVVKVGKKLSSRY
jgi:hypothetical protein